MNNRTYCGSHFKCVVVWITVRSKQCPYIHVHLVTFIKMSRYRNYGNIWIQVENNHIGYEFQYNKSTLNEHEAIHIRFIKYVRKNTPSAITFTHMYVQSFQAEVTSLIFRRQTSAVRPTACVPIVPTEAYWFCKIYSVINLI